MTNKSEAQRLNRLRGGPVHALDGDIGTVVDFYFDDDTWTVRYVVVDTGKWLRGRQVLIPLWALHTPDWDQMRIPVRITRDQVKRSPNVPDVDTHEPVSRRAEIAALTYYRYPFYWGGPLLWGTAPSPGLAADIPPSTAYVPPIDENQHETHLRSCREVTGYHIQARDGEIGHVDDFVIDAETWGIRHLLIDTSNWIGGRSVLMSPNSIKRVSWSQRVVEVSVSREAVAHSPEAERVT
jgi:uncharacterized protein YrrD